LTLGEGAENGGLLLLAVGLRHVFEKILTVLQEVAAGLAKAKP